MHSKGNHTQNEKTTYRMGENICKQCDQQRINLQSLDTAHEAQSKKIFLIKKWAEDLIKLKSFCTMKETTSKVKR